MSESLLGLKLELKLSVAFHAAGLPLLVSPLLLRSRNLGQMDLARLKKEADGWIIEIGEVKSSTVGAQQMEYGQRGRLFAAQNFLSGIFGYRSKLIRMIG